MTQVKAKDLVDLPIGELRQKRDSFEKELFNLRQQKTTGQLDKPHQFKLVRKQVARINTVLRQKVQGEIATQIKPSKAITPKKVVAPSKPAETKRDK